MARIDTQQQTAFFVRGPSPFARLIFFGMLSIILMATDGRLHYLTEIRQAGMALLRPLEIVATAPIGAVDYVGDYLVTQVNLVEENRTLRLRALQQQADLQRMKSLDHENAHLRNLLGAAQASTHNSKLGEIIHAGRDPFTRKVTVNLGQQHGVSAGRAVIDEDGVIGQVTRVYPFTSEVTLVTNKELAVPIQVERTGMRAIAFGQGRTNTISLPYLPVNVDIQQGDMLVTSGIDGVYPAGLAVARVTQIERTAGTPFARITCVPAAGISTHRQILIVEMQQTAPSGVDIAKPAPKKVQHAPRKS